MLQDYLIYSRQKSILSAGAQTALPSLPFIASGLKAGVTMLSMIGIAPHPPIIIPAIGRNSLNEAQQTVDGMKQLGSLIKEAAPELLIIITPHGQVLREGPAVLTGSHLAGDFGQFGAPNIQIKFQTDHKLVQLLEEETLAESLRPVFLGDNNNLFRSGQELDHGSMVPLYYLQEAGVNAPGLHITFGYNPYRRLYQFGKALRRAVDKRGAPVVVIASGDLSHRLIPGAPASYNPRGAEFDRLLVELLRDGRVEDILEFDPQLVEAAGECGLRSIIIALGMFDGEAFTTEILSYEGPFGVGYLVAALNAAESD